MPIDPPVEWDAPSSPTELTPAERREIAEAMGLTVKIQFEPCPFGGSDEWCVIWRDGEWYAFAPDENPAQAFEVAREHGICVWFRDGAWHAAPAEEAFFSDLLEHWASAETAPLALCRCALALIRSAALTPPAPPEDKGP